MSEVTSLNPRLQMAEFFDFMYQEQTGYVYAPTKEADGNGWKQRFFAYPAEKQELIDYCIKNAPEREVYYSPALFREPGSSDKSNVKGTYVYWAEFDGQTPAIEVLGDLPAPSRRVRSSNEGHEHFYWRLNYFEVDVNIIERANRGLAYQLGADHSGWDANQVLRPIGTYNHKRGKPVIDLSVTDRKVDIAFSASIPEQPNLVDAAVDISRAPNIQDVIAFHTWDKEAFDLFRKPAIEQGARSSAMMRLGYYAAEMRLSDLEIYSVLRNADDRWGKFKGRNDRDRRLFDIINKARIKYPLDPVAASEDEIPVYGFQSFLDVDIKIEWVLEGLLQEQGYLLMSGPPGLGKSTVSLQAAIHMALGKDWLGYTIDKPRKCLFVSMEMGHADLKYFLAIMASELSPDELETLQQNLLLVPLGYGIMLDQPEEQRKIEALVADNAVKGVFFDSFGSTNHDSSDERTVKVIMDWNDHLRAEYGVFTWYIHHNRKAQQQNKKPNKLSDVYGSQYITARATTVLGLWASGSDIEVSGLKVRLAPAFPPFSIKRTGTGLNFIKPDPKDAPILAASPTNAPAEIDELEEDEPGKGTFEV